MLVLRVQAGFAAFRSFVAGTYRKTAPFITPSAAYGLLLNVAGIESRFDDGVSLMTRMRTDLPSASVAVGKLKEPQVFSLYQQLHSYPPGEGNKILDPATGRKVGERELGLARTKRGKWRITPVRRELLYGIDGYIALKDNDELEHQVRKGLEGGVAHPRPDGQPRYGVPFLGDNSYFIDRLTTIEPADQCAAHWYCRLRDLSDEQNVRVGTCRMTIAIDRADMSRTQSDLFAPQFSQEVPPGAWTPVAQTA